jgi:probable rRNA maturation factor
MELCFDDDIKIEDKYIFLMEKAAEECLRGEGLSEKQIDLSEVSISFVDRNRIRVLNRDYRNVDRETDVLSFPQYESSEDFPDDEIICLGDIVICLDKAKDQAEEFGHSLEREVMYLFTHSMLHLLGYDHMEDEEERVMRDRAEEVMKKLGLERKVYDHNSFDVVRLFRMALEAADFSYSPYSKFKVGAALLTGSGKIYTGTNVENISYGAGICAERTAVVKAVSEGETDFKAMAVASPGAEASPCGICRQVLAEFSPAGDMLVIFGKDEACLKVMKLSQLLPEAFSASIDGGLCEDSDTHVPEQEDV